MKKIFSFLTALAVSAMMFADITIAPENFKSQYGDGTFTIGEVEFAYSGAMYNTKNNPSGFAAKQLIQLRKSSNGAGEIKNNTSLNLKSITIATQNDKDFTLSAGTAADALEAVTKPSGTSGTYACKDNNDGDKTADVKIYKFDVSGKKFFDILNGSGAQYVAYIIIELAEGGEEEGPTYTVAGSNADVFGEAWDPEYAANDMKKQEDGSYKWEKTGLELAAGALEFKVCKDHSWAVAYPSENYELAYAESGVYTITITYEPENENKVSAVATKTADLVVLPKVVLHGNFTGTWLDTEEFVVAEDKKTASLELTLAEGTFNFGFKFDGTWKANGATIEREHNTTSLAEGSGDMSIVADQAGKYTFVYTFETQAVEVTFPALVVKSTLAEVYSLEKNAEVALKNVVVTCVSGKNVYVQDETAGMLLYLPADATWAVGDVLSGVAGVVDIYNGIYEVKLDAAQVAAVVAVAGAAPVPVKVTDIDAEKDMSKFVLLEGIEVEGTFVEGTASNINITFAGKEYVLRSYLKNAFTFVSGTKYDVAAIVSLYQSKVQLYFISAEEHQEPAKFYITGINDNWAPDAIRSDEDSYVLHLEAGDQAMKITVDGTWATEKDFTALTEVADGLFAGENNNICFKLDEAGDVTVTYTETVFKLEGNFHVDVVPADRRINAWGLNVVGNGESYTFSYNANIDGNEANLVFFKNGEEVGSIEIDAPKKGANEAVVAKEELPAGKDLTWGVELKANPVTEFAKVYDDATVLQRYHLAIDNSPESNFFGSIYGENRVGNGEGYIYAFNPDYSVKEAKFLAGQPKWQSAGRPWVDKDGTVLLADYGDSHGGVYVLDPATLTATSFYQGTQASSGLWTNGDVEVGSSTVAAATYGEGANEILIAVNEDKGNTLTKDGLLLFNVGQEDGSVLRTWGKAPSKVIPLTGNGGGNFALAPSSHGIFLGQNRAIPASGTNNNSTAYSVMMYDYDGNQLFVSDADHMPNLTANPGGGIALSADESQLVIIDQSSNIRLYNVAWDGNTPSVELAATYPCGYAAAGTLSFDFAGNLIGSMGTAYGTSMRLVVYGMPTENNEILVPAKKALTVSGVATAIEESFVPVKVEKVIRGGQVLIIKDGKTYNMMGQIVK